MSSAELSPMRVWRWPTTTWQWLSAGVLAAVLLAIGVPVLLSGPHQDTAAARLHDHGVDVTAHITGVETTGRPSPTVSIRFRTTTGQLVTASGQVPAGTYAVGVPVPVVYDPADPEHFAYGTRSDVDSLEPLWLATGAALTAAGAWQLLRTLVGLRLLRRAEEDLAPPASAPERSTTDEPGPLPRS